MKLHLTESNSQRYEYVRSKSVPDYDGFLTDYTMYRDTESPEERYVFVLGDSDYYDPNEDVMDFDWECESRSEANMWFDDYEGYLDESNTLTEISHSGEINYFLSYDERTGEWKHRSHNGITHLVVNDLNYLEKEYRRYTLGIDGIDSPGIYEWNRNDSYKWVKVPPTDPQYKYLSQFIYNSSMNESTVNIDDSRIRKLCERNPFVVVSYQDNSFDTIATAEGFTYKEDAETAIMFDLISYETCSALYDNTKGSHSVISKFDCDNIDWNYFENLPVGKGGLKPEDKEDVMNYFNPNVIGVKQSEQNIRKLLQMTKV